MSCLHPLAHHDRVKFDATSVVEPHTAQAVVEHFDADHTSFDDVDATGGQLLPQISGCRRGRVLQDNDVWAPLPPHQRLRGSL
jgi:hypothetical protein